MSALPRFRDGNVRDFYVSPFAEIWGPLEAGIKKDEPPPWQKKPCSEHLRLKELVPRGGPSRGGTLVDVVAGESCRGFVDRGDVRCAFGELPSVPATLVNNSLLRCISPAVDLSLPAHGRRGFYGDDWHADSLLQAAALEVTLDGLNYTREGYQFSFFDAERFSALDRVAPVGGPRRGGTRVLVHALVALADFGAITCGRQRCTQCCTQRTHCHCRVH